MLRSALRRFRLRSTHAHRNTEKQKRRQPDSDSSAHESVRERHSVSPFRFMRRPPSGEIMAGWPGILFRICFRTNWLPISLPRRVCRCFSRSWIRMRTSLPLSRHQNNTRPCSACPSTEANSLQESSRIRYSPAVMVEATAATWSARGSSRGQSWTQSSRMASRLADRFC